MRIVKKYKNNEYSKTKSGIWVRDLNKSAYPIDINNLTSEKDYNLFIQNEIKLNVYKPVRLDDTNLSYPNCIIVSDGYDFKNKQALLKTIGQECIVIGVNGALRKWNLDHGLMNFYVVNNPYPECCSFLPSVRYFPTCILASRTCNEFVRRYKGNLVKYTPTYDEKFSGSDKKFSFKIDDYRNPICAALGVAKFFNALNILLFCCDNSFKDERPGSEKLDNGLYTYPQHKVSHEIIDEIAYFLKEGDEYLKIGDFSSGYDYSNIAKISESDLSKFFEIS